MINSQDIKKGTCVRMDGKLYFCIDFLHRKPGKGNTIMNVTLKDVVNGGVIERRFNIGEKLEDVRVERRPYQYLYKDDMGDTFMSNETFEQIIIDEKLLNNPELLKEGENVEVVVHAETENVLTVDLPPFMTYEITYTEPGVRGDTSSTNSLKPATIETGATIMVPLFVNQGDKIKVDTRDKSYVERIK